MITMISCCDILDILRDRPERVLVIDTETTGLDPFDDELLQIAVIDGAGRTVFFSYVKPMNHTSWPDAQRVNGISPDFIRSSPPMKRLRDVITDVLSDAEVLVGYNLPFDLAFLRKAGIVIPDADQVDVMSEAADIFGRLSSLSYCASRCGFEFQAHHALDDAQATLRCCKKIGSWLSVPDEEVLI